MKRPPENTPRLYEQDGLGYNALVYAHYFVGGCDWFVTEYNPEEDTAFGWACLGDRQNAELGYIPLAELEAVRAPVTLRGINGPDVKGSVPVDYEDDWQPIPLQQAIDRLG